MSQETKPLDLGDAFRQVLNRHGFAFQYSVIRAIEEFNRQRPIEWDLEATEFPVSARGMSTKIDFILLKRKPIVYLIAECKRVNPAFSNWCFAGSAYARGSSRLSKLTFEYAWIPPLDKRLTETLPRADAIRMLTGTIQSSSDRAYDLGLSVWSNKTGDKNGKTTNAVEEAAGQVCKGLNGLIEHFNNKRVKFPDEVKFYFLPAIFTTAKIWTTDVDLASANLDKGEFDPGSVPIKEVDWIWYQYHMSPSLRHTVAIYEDRHISPFDLSSVLDQEFSRSIAIVSVKGIEDFVRYGFPCI